MDRVRRKVSDDKSASEGANLFKIIGPCQHVRELCNLHDIGMVLIIPTQFVSIHCGCLIMFFSTNRNSSSLATLLQYQISPTGSTQRLNSKRYLTSHLVREHQRNTSDTNPGSCAGIDHLLSRVRRKLAGIKATAEPLAPLQPQARQKRQGDNRT